MPVEGFAKSLPRWAFMLICGLIFFAFALAGEYPNGNPMPWIIRLTGIVIAGVLWGLIIKEKKQSSRWLYCVVFVIGLLSVIMILQQQFPDWISPPADPTSTPAFSPTITSPPTSTETPTATIVPTSTKAPTLTPTLSEAGVIEKDIKDLITHHLEVFSLELLPKDWDDHMTLEYKQGLGNIYGNIGELNNYIAIRTFEVSEWGDPFMIYWDEGNKVTVSLIRIVTTDDSPKKENFEYYVTYNDVKKQWLICGDSIVSG